MNKIEHSNYKEAAFRKYERDIATIVENFPEVVVLAPTHVSAGTYYSRIRSAIRGFLTHEYESEIVSKPQLRELFPAIKSAIRGDQVIFGSHENVKKHNNQNVDPSANVLQANVLPVNTSVADASKEVIRAFALLIAERYLETADFTGISVEEVQQIVIGFDVEVLSKNGRVYLI